MKIACDSDCMYICIYIYVLCKYIYTESEKCSAILLQTCQLNILDFNHSKWQTEIFIKFYGEIGCAERKESFASYGTYYVVKNASLELTLGENRKNHELRSIMRVIC